jgi:hypothetical protein
VGVSAIILVCKLVAFRGQIGTVGFWRLARLPQIADEIFFERAIQRGTRWLTATSTISGLALGWNARAVHRRAKI